MIILFLDPAISTGYCLVDVNESMANIYEYGYFDVDTSSNFEGDYCIDFINNIQELIDFHNVEHLGIEDYFFSKKFAKGCNLNVAFRTSAYITARNNSLEYTIIKITSWKKHVAGRVVPTKTQVAKWGKLGAKKLFIQQALWETYGIRFPNHSVSSKTGKPIKFRMDVVDVVAQAIYYCESQLGVRTIEATVDIPEDIIFKKSPKTLFSYE